MKTPLHLFRLLAPMPGGHLTPRNEWDRNRPRDPGEPTGPVTFCSAVLGGVTGAVFLLRAATLKTILVSLVTVGQSMALILLLLWTILIFGEPVTGSVYAIAGTLTFFAGIVMINL